MGTTDTLRDQFDFRSIRAEETDESIEVWGGLAD